MRHRPPIPGILATWYAVHLDRTLSILAAAAPESPAWTFSARGDQRVSWWHRRLAVELAIHRWDAQHAAGAGAASPPPLDGTVAAAGIEEFVTEFLPGLLARPGLDGLAGSVHLHATDGASEWWVNLDDKDSAVAVPGHRKAGTAIRATRSDLLLWLTNRAADRRAGDLRPARGRGAVGSAAPLTSRRPACQGSGRRVRTEAVTCARTGAPLSPAETVSARSQIAPVRSPSGPSR